MATKRRRYTKEEQAEAVKVVLGGNMSIAQVARDLGISNQNLSRWVKQARIDAGQGAPAARSAEPVG